MATHPIGPRSTSSPPSRSAGYSQAYLIAGLRAGLIALALLAILVVIALY